MRRFYHASRLRLLALALAVGFALFACAILVARPGFAAPPVGSVAAEPSTSGAQALRNVPGEVRVRDKVIFLVRSPRAGRSPPERARSANAVIDALLAHPDDLGEVRVEEATGTEPSAVVFAGKTPVITLGQEDVAAAGEATLHVLGAQVAARLSDALSAERKRSAIATTVFSLSLLVFSALIAFLLFGRVSELATRVREKLLENPERVTGLNLGKVELLSAGASRGALSIALTLGHRLTQTAIAYGWLIFGLSLFESTRGYTERLTGMVVTPLYGFAARIGTALPLAVVGGIAILAVSGLVRFVGLFFDSVARGDTRIEWMPRDLARPTSSLVRFAIIIVSLVLASPLISGNEDGALSRAGLVSLFAVALATTPLLASVAVGASVIFGRRFRKGEHVEIGRREGRVVDTTLFYVRLEDPAGCEVRVPHLLGLWHATRVHGHAPIATLDVVVDASARQGEVEEALLRAARELGSRAKVELVYLDDDGAHWRVTSVAKGGANVSLGRVVADAIASRGWALGRGHRPKERAPGRPRTDTRQFPDQEPNAIEVAGDDVP